jgi:predicted anti-sigma-YlaC factor YlaD
MGALKAGCERARELVSLELDEELSELGQARLRRHLECCPACRLYAAGARTVAEQLRATSLERPAVSVSVAGRRRRRRVLVYRTATAAAALVSLAGVVGLAGSLPAQAPTTRTAKAPYFEQRLLALARHAHGGVIDVS